MDVRRLAAAAVVTLLTACSASESDSTEPASETTTQATTGTTALTSGTDGVVRDLDVAGLETDLFRPTVEDPGDDGLPVAIMLHGTMGERTRVEPLAAAIAETGVLVYVPTWPVIDQVDPFPEGEGDEPFRRQSEAIVCMLREVKRTAADVGGDPNDVTLIGHSGGGMIGARVAIVEEPPWPGIDCDPGIDHRPDRFIGLAGDYTGEYQYSRQESDLYEPYDVLAIEPTNQELDAWLFAGHNDDAVNVWSAGRFEDHLAGADIDAHFLTTDTGHAVILDPSTAAGSFTAARIAAIIAGTPEPEWWPGTEPDATLAFDDDETCDYEGPETWSTDRAMTIRFDNRSPFGVSFALVSIRADMDVTRDEALAGDGILGEDNPDWVDWGGFREVPPGEDRTLHFAFAEADQTFVLYCHLRAENDHPMAGWMFPAALLEPDVAR